MNANEIAWKNQKIASNHPPYVFGLGSLGPIAPHERKSRGIYSGSGPSFVVKRIKDAVDQAKFNGRDLDIWVSSGWFTKTFTVKGDSADVASVKRWALRRFGGVRHMTRRSDQSGIPVKEGK